MKIHAFHLYNDFSGSPKVLQQLIQSWIKGDEEVHLYTSANHHGFLSSLPVTVSDNKYSLAKGKVSKLFRFFFSNLLMGCQLLLHAKKDDLVYINTALPFFPMWIGHWKGVKVICHVHESSIKPRMLKKLLTFSMKWACDGLIYVSRDLAERLPITGPRRQIIYNSLPTEFNTLATDGFVKTNDILMVCSLKKYKGVDMFTELAQKMPFHTFRLVLNAEPEEIDRFFTKEIKQLQNLSLLSGKNGVMKHYAESKILLNLSLPDQWVETFGLTALEAMHFGLPCIVPHVGGISEVIQDNKNGFCINPYATALWEYKIKQLLKSPSLYLTLSEQAKIRASEFSEKNMIKQHSAFINSILSGKSFQQMERQKDEAIMTC